MLASRTEINAEMKDLEKTLAMYREAFPENPAFFSSTKKKELAK